jgi:hypothetical protein
MYTLNLSAGQLEVITSLLEAEVSSILDEIRYAPETMHQYQDELIELVDLQDQIDYVFDAEDESYSDVCEDCSVSYSDDEETEYNDEDYQFKEHNLQQESNQFNAEKIDAMLRSFGFKIIR